MKFAIPRSLSPSPERVKVHSRGYRKGFTIHASDLDDSDDGLVEINDFAYSSEEDSDDDLRRAHRSHPNVKALKRSAAEQRAIDEALQGIRMRVSYEDPFELWHKEASVKAKVDAQQVYEERQRQLEAEYLRALNEQVKLRSLRHQQQMEEVRQLFSGMRVHHGEEENRLRTEFEKRDQALWSSVQQAIDDEERKIAAQKAEEERKVREELLCRQREEKARQEAQAQKEQKEKEERLKKELELKKLQKEAEEIRIREERQRQEAIEQRKQAEQLSAAGIRPALDEWEEGRRMLSILKKEVHPAIKADRELKSLRNKLRRQVTPKIGQLTSELEQINRVTRELEAIHKPTPPHPPLIYNALLSATAKAFLLQAETEVTAKPDAAMPLALVLVNLLVSLPDFGSILYARLIQRLGFWAVPFPAPTPVDAPKEEKDAIHGLRREDTEPEKRLIRIGGIMTLLFCVMHTEHPQPLPEMFRLGRFWTYIARLLSSKELCASNVSLEILRAALAVSGDKALRVWGKQWVKVLNVIENRTEETSSSIIGENGVAGTARRVRIKTEIRKMMIPDDAGSTIGPTLFS